jgi:hypothetical protein
MTPSNIAIDWQDLLLWHVRSFFLPSPRSWIEPAPNLFNQLTAIRSSIALSSDAQALVGTLVGFALEILTAVVMFLFLFGFALASRAVIGFMVSVERPLWLIESTFWLTNTIVIADVLLVFSKVVGATIRAIVSDAHVAASESSENA